MITALTTNRTASTPGPGPLAIISEGKVEDVLLPQERYDRADPLPSETVPSGTCLFQRLADKIHRGGLGFKLAVATLIIPASGLVGMVIAGGASGDTPQPATPVVQEVDPPIGPSTTVVVSRTENGPLAEFEPPATTSTTVLSPAERQQQRIEGMLAEGASYPELAKTLEAVGAKPANVGQASVDLLSQPGSQSNIESWDAVSRELKVDLQSLVAGTVATPEMRESMATNTVRMREFLGSGRRSWPATHPNNWRERLVISLLAWPWVNTFTETLPPFSKPTLLCPRGWALPIPRESMPSTARSSAGSPSWPWRAADSTTGRWPCPTDIRASSTPSANPAREVWNSSTSEWAPGGRTERVGVHREISHLFRAAFEEVDARGLGGEIRSFGGIYNYRSKRNGSSLSVHSWGIAMDINSAEYPLGTRVSETDGGHHQLAEVFTRYGFVQLDNDAHHFQYATGF